MGHQQQDTSKITSRSAMCAAELWSSSDPEDWEAALDSTMDVYSKHASPKLQELNKCVAGLLCYSSGV
jgi:hypothetical protein